MGFCSENGEFSQRWRTFNPTLLASPEHHNRGELGARPPSEMCDPSKHGAGSASSSPVVLDIAVAFRIKNWLRNCSVFVAVERPVVLEHQILKHCSGSVSVRGFPLLRFPAEHTDKKRSNTAMYLAALAPDDRLGADLAEPHVRLEAL